MKAKDMAARFGAATFVKVALVAAAICMAATSALADVTNLENYRFRYDFSKGKNNFITSQNVIGNFVGTSIVAVEGPNGANDAVHVSGIPWSAFNSQSVLNSDWTFAMSVKFGNTEGGILMGIGRLPSNGSKEIAICSSSDKSKLYLRELSRPSSTHTTAGSYTLTELGDVTQGYHTLVIVHKHSSDYKGTLYFYWDGVSKGSYTMKTGKPFGSSSSISGMQFGQLMTAGSGTFSNVKYVATGSDNAYSFYDLRLYAGQFSAADVAAYAALYPCTYPFRPNAYVEANGCNAIDTGVKPSAAVRYLADFQYLDTLGGRRIFGTGSTGTDGEDASGQGVFADLYIDGSAASGGSFARALHGPYVADSTWIGLNVTADRFRRWFDLDGHNATSKLYDNNWAQSNTDNVTIQNLPAASDAESALSTRLFATQYAENAPINNSTARIYTFEVYRSGTLEAFFAPTVDGSGNAGFTNIVAGTFHGEEMESPARVLRFYNGVGCASDYKYEDGTLSAKVYVTTDGKGTVRVADGEAAVSANGWMPRGGTVTLSAIPIQGYKFTEWIGDTGAIVSGYNVTNATIVVSGAYPLQLRATFERGAGYGWTGATGDGKFSTSANWENFATGEVATEPPAPGTLLSFMAATGGTLVNDIEDLGGADIVFPEGAGAYTITGNCFTNVANVINESASVQTLSNEVFFATTYNVAIEKAVNFAGGATATLPGTASGAACRTLTGNITFTFTTDWVPSGTYNVPSGSRFRGYGQLGHVDKYGGGTFRVDAGGYARVASVVCGRNNTSERLTLVVNGTLEVDGRVSYQNNGSGGNVERVQGSGTLIAKSFYKTGGKRHMVSLGNFVIGAGSAENEAPGFGATYGSNQLQFMNNVTIRTMVDMEFQNPYTSSEPSMNGAPTITNGKTLTVNTEDLDGNGHEVIWGCGLSVRKSSGSDPYSLWDTGNVTVRKAGKGRLIMRNRCSLTSSSGYKKLYNGNTHIDGGTLRVEEAGQLGKGSSNNTTWNGSTLNINDGGTFELAANVNLPNNVKLNGGGHIVAEDGSTIVLNSSSGNDMSISLGANAKITGNVTLGTNSTLTAGLGATISGDLTMGDGTTAVLGGDFAVPGALTTSGAVSLTRAAGVETNVTVAVTGAITASGTLTVGPGVIFDIGANRPTGTGTLAVDNDATIVLRKANEKEGSIVLNVTSQPQNIVVYDTDGTTEISDPEITYNSDAGTLTIRVALPIWTNTDGSGSLDSADNWTAVPGDGDDVVLNLTGDVAITSSGAKAFNKMRFAGAYSVDFTGADTITLSEISVNDVTNIVTGGKLRFSAIDIPQTCTVAVTGAEGLADGGLSGTGTLVIDPGAGNAYTMGQGYTEFTGEAVVRSGTVEFVAGSTIGGGFTMGDGTTAVFNGNLDVPGAMTTSGAVSLTRAAGVETNVTVAAKGTLATTGTITVGPGVIFDFGVNRPTGTFTVDDGAALAMRKTGNFEESIVLNVTAKPKNIVVYDTDGTTAMSIRTVTYDSDAGTVTIVVTPRWTNNDGTGSLDSAANWTGMPEDGDNVVLDLTGDVAVTSSVAKAFNKMKFTGAYSVDFSCVETITLSSIELNNVTNLVTGGNLKFTAIDIPQTCTVTITGGEGLSNGKLTGKGTLVIDPGEGNTYTMTKNNTSFTGEAVIKSGTVKFGGIDSFGPLGRAAFIRVKGGAALDENKILYYPSSGEKLSKAILEEGATLQSNPGYTDNIQYSVLTTIKLEGNATVDTSSGNVTLSERWHDHAVALDLGTNTLTVTGNHKFGISQCTISGTGTLDVQSGATIMSTHDYDGDSTTTCAAGTILIREGATWNLANYQNHVTKLSVKNFILDGSVTRAASTYTLTVTGSITGNGTTPMLTMGSGAKFKPTGTGYLNVTASLSGTLKVDLDGLVSYKVKIPLVKVPTALKATVDAALDLSDVPAKWKLETKEDGGNVEYYLHREAFTIFLR